MINVNFPSMGSFVVFDTETTGLSYDDGAEVIELAAIKVNNDIIVDTFNTFVYPERGISPEAQRINNISADMLINAPKMQVVLNNFTAFIQNEVLIAHNAAFDLKFLNGYARYFYGRQLSNNFLCTLEISRELLPNQKHTLSSLVEYFGISAINTHRALDDCRSTVGLLSCLNTLLMQSGNNMIQAGYVHKMSEFKSYDKKMSDYYKNRRK